ncbi:hypothetical protein SLA2020_286790 [Shorea laevis]
MLKSMLRISLGRLVSDSMVVIGLLDVFVWRRLWDRSGSREVKPVVVPKLSVKRSGCPPCSCPAYVE